MKQQEDSEEQKMGYNLRQEERWSELRRMRSGTEKLWDEGDKEIIGQKGK